MARVEEHHGKSAASVSARPNRHRNKKRDRPSKKADHNKRAEPPQRKTSYKVVYEEIDVDNKEKKLRTLLYTEQKAPPGYTFIPAGDPQMTNRCKREAMDDELTVYIVSAANDSKNGIAVQVHRVGYHFPSVSVEKACQSLGVSLTASGHVSQSRLAPFNHGVANTTSSKRQATKNKQKTRPLQVPKFNMTNLKQAVIDTQAREAIKDLFPKIPVDDLHTVIGRSFQKGKNLVGTADGLTLVHRAQLAVLAHIRHSYTNYDTLLRHYEWVDARKMIEQLCLDKIISWRGDEDDANKMDDILREVIVIDDDDDDEDQKQKSSAMLHNRSRRESSLEIIPADALQTQAIDYADVNQNDHEGRSFSHELDNEDTLPNPGRGPLYRQKQSRFDQNRLEQMAQHRSRRYEEALDRRRKYPEPIYIAGDNSISLSQDRAAGKASASSSQIRPLELYEMESRDRMVGALEHHDLQPMRAADNHILPRETRQAPSEQVAYPFQQLQPLQTRETAQPALAQYSIEAAAHGHHEFYQANTQHSWNASHDDKERFARSKDPFYEASDFTYAHNPAPRPDMALPSIEGGFASPTNQQAPHRIRTQQDDPFAFVDFANRLVPQNLVPSKVHQITYEEPPPGKKRRIDEQEYFETQNEESTILIPLDDRGGYHAMRQRPGGAGRDAQWPRLDSRIVPLPPRDAAGIQDPQGRVHNVSHHGQTEDRLIHRLPRAHFEVSLPSAEARGQPQSLLHSDAGQSGYFRQSPTVFNASESAQSYREVHNFRPILPHASGSVGSGGQVLANPQPVAERSQCFDDAGREMRNNLRNLAIDERQYRDCPGLQEDLMARCVIYARPQPASPKAYGIPRPRENMYSERPKDYTERARVDMLPQSGNMQYQPGNRQNGRGVQHFPLQVEQKPANPFERPLPQSGQMSDAQGWSDLQQPPSWLPPADPVSSRTYNAPPQGQPLYLQEESQIPSSDMRSGRMGNGRPIHQIYEGVRRLDRRAPEQVIVLND